MNKTVVSIVGAISLMAGLSGCVTTPAGPSVASQGAGSDTAYLNASRGRADAQVTAAQAEQYSRQRQQVKEEMELEQQKRQGTIDNVNGMLRGVGSLMSIIPH